MNERGSILITSLWAVSLLSMMSASLVFNASQSLMLMKRESQAMEARADFISAVNHAAVLLVEDPQPHEDSPQDAWYGPVAMPPPFNSRMSVQIEDEESKLNLNEAPEPLLKAFFKVMEKESAPLKGSAKDYVTAIVKMRSRKRIQSLQELFLIDGFDPADYARLAGDWTVYPESGRLNLNTAKPLILKALIQTLSGDQSSKLILIGRLDEACKGKCNFLSEDLYPEKFSDLLKLPRTPFMQQLVQDFLSKITVDSETFKIEMSSRGRRAEAVFKFRTGMPRPEVLYWHED